MKAPTFICRRMVYETSLLTVGIYAALGPEIHPSVAIMSPLRMDIIALAVLGALTLLPYWEGVEDGFAENRTGGVGVRPWAPPILAGGLIGAAVTAPLAAFPWLGGPALAIAWAVKVRNGTFGWGRSGVAVAVLAAVANCGLIAGSSSHGLWIPPEDFASRDFRVNSLLADVPIHDVLAIDLKGNPAPTLDDVANALKHSSPFQTTPPVAALSMLRGLTGVALGWEDPTWAVGMPPGKIPLERKHEKINPSIHGPSGATCEGGSGLCHGLHGPWPGSRVGRGPPGLTLPGGSQVRREV